MAEAVVPTAHELRREVREWRRGRADLRWGEVLSDAYVALFGLVMVAATGGNVVLTLRQLADATCTGTCREVRTAAPWLVALAVALLALGLARLLGPVFSPPAANAWLLSTPVDRGALLRPAWWRTVALALVGSVALLLPPAVLGGLPAPAASVLLVAGGVGATACIGVAALSQVHEHRAARWLTWSLVGLLWAGLALAATDGLPAATSRPPDPLITAAAGAALVAVVAVASLWRTTRDLGRVTRRVLGRTEHLSPSLSGALSSVDLGLMYDVLLARRWSGTATVRPRTGGPSGWWSLVHRDVLRAVRAPQPLLLLAGLVLVPYAVAEADAGRAVVLATTLAGLLAGPALCPGLRVVVRTRSIARMMPFRGSALALAHLVVPGVALTAFAVASVGTLRPVLPTLSAVLLALACGLSSLAATVRWVTGKPPDYAAPMVSTPAGAVPTGVFSSAVRGFDVWALTALPLVLGPVGTVVSVVVSLGVIAYLVTDEAR